MHRHAASRGASGFSLVELMVTVAIIGILASIALPSYNEHVRKGRRAGGAACAAAMAQGMERYYTTALTYVGAPAAATLDDRCDPDALAFYEMRVENVGQKTYRVEARRRSGTPQAGDSCGTLSIDHTGAKLPATAGCW